VSFSSCLVSGNADAMIYSLMYRNPVYHQCVFATLMISTVVREAYLLRWSEASKTIPDKKKSTIIQVLRTGAFGFIFGFIIWNLDNIFCDSLTRVKLAVGWPIAFLLEGKNASSVGIIYCLTQRSGHAWWHVLTVSINLFPCHPPNIVFVGAQGIGTFYLNQGVACTSVAFLITFAHGLLFCPTVL
jgi:Ceramidase